MKRKSNLLVIILILSSLGLILFPKFVIGSIEDIHYTFENDIIYESNDISYSNEFNIRTPYTYTDFYNASYSFVNETIGTTGTDIIWINTTNLGVCEIEGLRDNHNKSIIMTPSVAWQSSNSEIDDQVSGTIEFWIRFETISARYLIYLYDGANILTVLFWDNDGNMKYTNGGEHTIVSYIADSWIHIRIDFECGAGSYLGLGADTFKVHVNDKEYGAYNYFTPTLHLDNFKITYQVSDLTSYVSAIGYSWLSNYTIGINILPTIEINTDLKEVDRYEFGMSDIDTFHSTGTDNPNGWSDVEDPSGDKVGIAIQGNVNGLVYSSTNVIADNRGITKGVLGITGDFINVSFGIIPEVLNGIVNRIEMTLVSSDNNPITRLRILADLSVEYQEADTSWIDIGNDITLLREYEFNIFLNYELDRVFLLYFQDGVFENVYSYEMFFSGKSGLNEINIISISIDTNTISYFVDYVGIYSNGVSQVGLNEDFGLATRLLTDVSNWNYEHNNLFNIIANGNFHLGVVDGVYSRASTLFILKDTFNYISESSFLNLYDGFVSVIPIPRLVFTLVSGLFNISYIKIDGCKLIQNFNKYFLQYSHSGIDTNESYFYVDNNNKLQFTLITNDTDTEYIQAIFNISDVSSTDRAISFKGIRLNKAFGYFYVDYILGASRIDIPIIEKTTRAILPTNKTIDSFIVLISDNNIDSIIGITTGHVSYPKLLNVLGLGLPIITAGLIEMMIPLLLILLPTLLISKGFGKEGKKLLIPLFLVFSIIATATLIIPIWIFFIIAFGIGLFLFRNKEIKDDY